MFFSLITALGQLIFVLSLSVSSARVQSGSDSVCENVYPHLSCGLTYTDSESCASAGCCWDASATDSSQRCFSPKIYGYQYKESSNSPGVRTGKLYLNRPSGLQFGTDFSELDITVTQETSARTHIKIVPSDGEPRWEVPENLLPRPGGVYTGDEALVETVIKSQNDDDEYDNMEILMARTSDKSSRTNELIFVFTKMLVYQDQYIQFVLGVPNKVSATYGLGESTRKTQKIQYNSTFTLWNTDQGASNFDQSLYGSHPFYIQVTEDGKANGLLFMNSNAMEITATESATQGNTLGFQSTGGIVDLYVFAGPTPQDVVKQYQEVIGKPAMVPFWALGFHNCRWGYPNIEYVEEVVANYSNARIPLETQWTDIDYMEAYKDFTFSEANFPLDKMQSFVNTLHAKDMHYVPIVDPAIYVLDSNYSTFNEGMKLDVFVKDMYGQNPYLSQVWPGPTYFPDWFAPQTQSFWSSQLKVFHDNIGYDGIWIDMNEASNFCNADGKGQICTLLTGPCESGCCINCTTVDPHNKYDFPPYVPNVVWGNSLGGKTIAMSGLHSGNILEYNAHNLYGFMESMSTRQGLLDVEPSKRPFVLSRSTTMGSGKYAAHWTGDNAATWDDLKASIITMNNLALFGMSITGADICGFNGETTEELCARWIEVGAFSPFSRDHNAIGMPPQELYRWSSVAYASQSVLGLRYQLLPYLYTLSYNAHINGDLIMNAMWVNYPSDPLTLAQDGQYMWSDGILFTPVLTQGATSVTGYFPKGMWYSLMAFGLIDSSAGGQYVDLATPLTSTNVHVRGGRVIPMQHAGMTTKAVATSPYTYVAALDETLNASGSLYVDDGIQEQLESYALVTFTVSGSTFKSVAERHNFDGTAELELIKVMGLKSSSTGKSPVCTATLATEDGRVLSPNTIGYMHYDNATYALQFSFSTSQNVNAISNFELNWVCA